MVIVLLQLGGLKRVLRGTYHSTCFKHEGCREVMIWSDQHLILVLYANLRKYRSTHLMKSARTVWPFEPGLIRYFANERWTERRTLLGNHLISSVKTSALGSTGGALTMLTHLRASLCLKLL